MINFPLVLGLLVFFESSVFGLTQDHSVPPPQPSEHEFLKSENWNAFKPDFRLKRNVDFWVRIYSEVTSSQGFIHDSKYIDHVYEKVDFEQEKENSSSFIKKRKSHWREVLFSVHKKQNRPETMTQEERRIFELFEDVSEPNKFLNAAHRKRLRFQLGQKDRFLDGLYQSGAFLGFMEEIFKKQGLPLELTRLPFVESSFNLRARSKVGASGVWQFMRSTARLFIQVNSAVDERNDPVRATEAAAQLLKDNYESLKSWPLAVTAYNHGRKGVMRAVRVVGSNDLEDLIKDYRSRSFGFASSNFFAELLAAIEVEKNSEKYFGKVERGQAFAFIEFQVPDFIELKVLEEYLSLDPKQVRLFNPGLTDEVFAHTLLVPGGYFLRIPLASGVDPSSVQLDLQQKYSKIPSQLKLKAQRPTNYGRRLSTLKKTSKRR
ncbi:MAG: lytic transglycosylase domain-containing protein [Bdellovibrionia bacterium]